jgi:hypothetical protein
VTAPPQDEVRRRRRGTKHPSLTASGGGYSAFAPACVGGARTASHHEDARREIGCRAVLADMIVLGLKEK